MVFPVTLEITGGRYFGVGLAFFFLLPANAEVTAMANRRTNTATNGVRFMISCLTEPQGNETKSDTAMRVALGLQLLSTVFPEVPWRLRSIAATNELKTK